jgi:hypothetical protein
VLEFAPHDEIRKPDRGRGCGETGESSEPFYFLLYVSLGKRALYKRNGMKTESVPQRGPEVY